MSRKNCKHNTIPEENTRYATIYYTTKIETEPYRCPVCNGRGLFPGDFILAPRMFGLRAHLQQKFVALVKEKE